MQDILESFFKKYELMVKQVDSLVTNIRNQFPKLFKCKIGCSDCCYALFDLTFIEAMYLNKRFIEVLPEEERDAMAEVSNKVDRKIHKLKREAQNAVRDGKQSTEQVLYKMSTIKIRCPLFNSDHLCKMYKYRPITCRVYGVPTSFAGRGHTCGLSGFETGKSYPTINLDSVHKKLHSLSNDLVKEIKSRHVGMSQILMPVSMVLLTEFNDEYLGIPTSKQGKMN